MYRHTSDPETCDGAGGTFISLASAVRQQIHPQAGPRDEGGGAVVTVTLETHQTERGDGTGVTVAQLATTVR